jgi:hypothetical protein
MRKEKARHLIYVCVRMKMGELSSELKLDSSGMHIISVIVISPLILIIIKSPHLILIDSINYIDYTLIS